LKPETTTNTTTNNKNESYSGPTIQKRRKLAASKQKYNEDFLQINEETRNKIDNENKDDDNDDDDFAFPSK
jgi:hypothetical protein